MTATSTVHEESRSLQVRDEAAFMVCGVWMVIGLFIDGWSHQVDKPETFFTPWHFVLYSGFGAAMLYSGYMSLRDSKTGVKTSIGDDRITSLGVAIFVVGAIGDGAWHTFIGIEVDIEGLISPTHLALMIGGLLMVTLPVRSALRSEEPIDRSSLVTVLVSITLALGVVSFFLMYMSPWQQSWVYERGYVPDIGASNTIVQHGMAMVLVTTALFVGALLWAARRWTLPAGTATVMFTVVAFGLSGMESFDVRLPILAATVAGIVADVLLARQRSLHIVGMVSSAALWIAYFTLLHVESGVEWGPSLWAGAIVFGVMTGLGAGVLVSSGATRSTV